MAKAYRVVINRRDSYRAYHLTAKETLTGAGIPEENLMEVMPGLWMMIPRSKEEWMNGAYPEGITFDWAYPQPWADQAGTAQRLKEDWCVWAYPEGKTFGEPLWGSTVRARFIHNILVKFSTFEAEIVEIPG